MKKVSFAGSVRTLIDETGAEIRGRIYSDKRVGGHRVKAILNQRLSGQRLYHFYAELSKLFPAYEVKVSRYETSGIFRGTRSGITVHFTLKGE